MRCHPRLEDAGAQTHYLYDGLGSTTDLTDGSGRKRTPSKRRTVEVGAVEWNVEFEGSPPGGLYYLRARYYDPETGRFLSQDPIPGVNPYAYVGNKPVRFVDPSGRGLIDPGLPRAASSISVLESAVVMVARNHRRHHLCHRGWWRGRGCGGQ